MIRKRICGSLALLFGAGAALCLLIPATAHAQLWTWTSLEANVGYRISAKLFVR